PARRGLLGDRLGTVLAELGRAAVLRVRPRAPRAVEAVVLVDPRERARRACRAHLLDGDPQRVDDRGQPRGRALGSLDVQPGLVDPLLGWATHRTSSLLRRP